MTAIFLLLIITKVKSALGGDIIDIDDILAEDYMPGTLLMLENPHSTLKTNETIQNITLGDASFNYAMETMGYHRSMMNEYLCRSYIAEQIVNNMTLSRIKRRMGTDTQSRSSKVQQSIKNQLLNDEGSTNYKDWLHKSTTLEDIYRHYDTTNRLDDRSEGDKEDDVNEDYDGQITGFAYQQQHQQQQTSQASKLGHSGSGGSTIYITGGGGGYPFSHGGSQTGGGSYGHSSGPGHGPSGGHGDYGVHVIQEHEIHDQPKFQIYHHEENHEKDHDLSDLFDIALTALAYLSFGMFIVHVIMCISSVHNTATTTASMMMPMSMSPTLPGMSGGGMTGTGTGGGAMPGTGGDNTGMGIGGDTGMGGEMGMGGDTGMGTDMDMGGNAGMGGDTDMGGDGDTSMGMDGNTGMGGDTGNGNGQNDNGMGGNTGDGDANNGGGGDSDDSENNPVPTGNGSTGTNNGDEPTGEEDSVDQTGETGDMEDTGDTGETELDGRDTINFRVKRNTSIIPNPDNKALNELARKILASIEASFVANEDDGNCLRQVLCENNKYSREISGRNKILIPVWSLGMSWLSGRLVKNVSSATSMLDSLKASILGLGKANCEILYHNCNLRQQKKERRRRRRNAKASVK